ncbi:TPA: hypothetical protein ENX78_00485 [Candidatus Poribacteria bacterium]|nr:hypothetical protein [Candidatus Poribacteria bacterium]
MSFIHKKEHFCRAVLEGVAFSIKDCSSIFEELGLKLDDLKDDLRIIGGGSKSKLWRQMIANVFNKRLLKPVSGDASLGSALLAGVGIGIFKNLKEAVESNVKIENITTPNFSSYETYNKFF